MLLTHLTILNYTITHKWEGTKLDVACLFDHSKNTSFAQSHFDMAQIRVNRRTANKSAGIGK